VRSTSQPGTDVADPDVAAAVRLLHRRHGWSRAAATCFIAFVLAEGADASAQSQGTPAPSWFVDMIIALGALTAGSIIAAVVYSAQLRRRPPRSGRRPPRSPHATQAARMPTTTRPGIWSHGSCAGSGCW
jgi:hypothetical protein